MGKKPFRIATATVADITTTNAGTATRSRWLRENRSRNTGASQEATGRSVCRFVNGRRAAPTSSQSHDQERDSRPVVPAMRS